MKIKPLALLVVLFLLIANTVEAKSLLLRLKLQKGAVYEKTEIINEKIEYEKNGETITKTKQMESTPEFEGGKTIVKKL